MLRRISTLVGYAFDARSCMNYSCVNDMLFGPSGGIFNDVIPRHVRTPHPEVSQQLLVGWRGVLLILPMRSFTPNLAYRATAGAQLLM